MMQTVVEMKQSNELNPFNDPYLAEVFKPENRYKSSLMLTIKEFIEMSKFPIDSFMVDNFFNNLNDDIPVYVNNELIEWCGFNGKDFDKRKELFVKILKQFEKGIDFWCLTNIEYSHYYQKSIPHNQGIEKGDIGKSINYPHPTTFTGKNKTKHIILTTNCFKMVLMMLNTKKAKEIREYYLALEKLIKVYSKYQYYQKKYENELLKISNDELHRKVDSLIDKLEDTHNKLKDTHNKLEETHNVLEHTRDELKETREDLSAHQEILTEINHKFDVATDERAPRTTSIRKRDKFIILKINDPNYQWQYYVVRIQHGACNAVLKRLRLKYPRYTEFMTIKYQPNSVNFFNLMKEKLPRITVNRNEVKLEVGYNEAQFRRDVQDLDISKKEVEFD